jgi:hypothetical protein
MARATSKISYIEAQERGVLSKRRTQVCLALWNLGSGSSREVWEHIKRTNPIIPQHSINPRMVELERAGMVEEHGVLPCKFTGRPTIQWSLTKHIPKEWPKPPKQRCPACGHVVK